MSRPLFEIGADLLALDDLLTEAEGDISHEQTAAAVDAFIAELTTERAAKLDGYAGLIRTLEAREAIAKAEADRFAKAAKAAKAAVEGLKGRLLAHMLATKESRLTSATGRTFSVTPNSTAPVVIPDDLDLNTVDHRFVRVQITREVDTRAVREALAHGESVPFARFGERGVHLRLR